jgi:uncharacterized membrane protein YbhN (UPF0104 family)
MGLIALAWPWLGRWHHLPQRLKQFGRIPRRWILLIFGAYTLAWLLGGLILDILILAATPSVYPNLWKITALWALGGGASLLAVIAPAGLGVRELTLTVLLQPYLGTGLSLALALLFRVLFTLGDLIWGGLFWVLSKNLT